MGVRSLWRRVSALTSSPSMLELHGRAGSQALTTLFSSLQRKLSSLVSSSSFHCPIIVLLLEFRLCLSRAFSCAVHLRVEVGMCACSSWTRDWHHLHVGCSM